jgi:hypothetical protein
MNDTQFSKWVKVSEEEITVYTRHEYTRAFAWVLFFVAPLGLAYYVYTHEQKLWCLWLSIPLSIFLLFQATRKVVFKPRERIFIVQIAGIIFRKETWQKIGGYSLGHWFVEPDKLLPRPSRRDRSYPLYLCFDTGRVWIAQVQRVEELRALGAAVEELLKARI